MQSQKAGRHTDGHMDPRARCLMTKFTSMGPKRTLTGLLNIQSKKFMLVFIERCQNTKCNAVCCVQCSFLVLHTTTHLQGSSEVHTSMGLGCFGSKRWTNTILGRWS